MSQRCEAVIAHAKERKAFRGAVSVSVAACPSEPVASGVAASGVGRGGNLAIPEQTSAEKKSRIR